MSYTKANNTQNTNLTNKETICNNQSEPNNIIQIIDDEMNDIVSTNKSLEISNKFTSAEDSAKSLITDI